MSNKAMAGSASQFLNANWRTQSRQRLTNSLRDYTVYVLLIALVLIASLLSDVFLTTNNLLNIVRAVSVLGIVAIGQTILLITANFDMSVSMVVPFAGMVAIGVQNIGGNLFFSVLSGICAGLLVGFANGFLVSKTRANPFLITFGMQSLIYSLSLIITDARTWYASIPEYNIVGRESLWDAIPYSVLIFLGLAVLMQYVLHRTTWGKSLFALGYNEEATILSGINTHRIKLTAFMFSGFCAGLAGIVMSSRLNSTNASGAVGFEFESLIAAVLGGTSLFGGSGSTLKTVAGVIVLGVLNNLLILMAAPYELQLVVKGAVFLIVVWIDGTIRRGR